MEMNEVSYSIKSFRKSTNYYYKIQEIAYIQLISHKVRRACSHTDARTHQQLISGLCTQLK